VLTLGNHQVETAGDGAEALARLDQALPDLLITDVEMPHLNGAELVRCLRRNGHRHLPIIAISGHSRYRQELAPHVQAYLVKPFGFRQLLAEVASALARRTARP
jgi:CheY-like chemotaxis protein